MRVFGSVVEPAPHLAIIAAAKLREFAPFNAMLLHIQKPGLTHAATAQDWHKRFGRVPKMGAPPLLVLRTKGPVDCKRRLAPTFPALP